MIKVTALTSGRNIPSSRFRIRQHIHALKTRGILVSEFFPLINKYMPFPLLSKFFDTRSVVPIDFPWQVFKLLFRIPGLHATIKSDLTWLGRELCPGYLTLEGLIRKPIIFDVDDAIWLAPPFGQTVAKKIAQMADLVLAGNDYIADWFKPFARKVEVIPTGVDTNIFTPVKNKNASVFSIGWIGTSGNLRYLYSIEEPLCQFLSLYKDSRLMVVSDQLPRFKSLPSDQLECVRWTASAEVDMIRSMDVGLMPLFDNDWCRGKCALKLLLYLSCGIPAVASSVGMSETIIKMAPATYGIRNKSEWFDALCELYQNPSLRLRMGKAGRELVAKHFASSIVQERLTSIFKTTAE